MPAALRRGRGATANPSGRFERERRVAADETWDFADGDWGADDGGADEVGGAAKMRTTVTADASKTVLVRQTSPDIPFDRSINPYRGCEHGCVYCFARPSHEFLGLSAGLDFETRLFAKPDAAAVLRRELAARSYRCATIAMGTNTDPYQPVERRLRITRQILELLLDCRHPVAMVTKSAGIVRDLGLWSELAARRLGMVHVSVTTLDAKLARDLEPRAATPAKRLEAISRLADAGVPVGVMVAPVIPGLNDTEMEAILAAAKEAGATAAGKVLLRLPHGVAELFRAWLAEHRPERAARVMALVRDTRGGRDNEPRFHRRMTGSGAYAAMLDQRFRHAAARLGLGAKAAKLDTTRFRPPPRDGQLPLL
ncbi:MAG: PA0069 family radical SAM protein [Proteobacteria bacterium]|nr:PA0069 family radical SAM protein [Pseudomonadota bacterium]